MSGLDISERVLPTLNGHLSHGSALSRNTSDCVTRKFVSGFPT